MITGATANASFPWGPDAGFVMAFQPIVDFERREVFAHEALVRGALGEGALEVFSRVNPEHRFAFHEACRVKAIETASALGMESKLSLNILPNGNPAPGPKFDYKLAWFERLNAHAARLFRCGMPVVLAGDFNVVPTDADIYNPASWRDDALLQPESRAAFARLLAQGWTDALRTRHPGEPIYTYWDYWRNRWPRNAGLRIDHLLLNDELAPLLADANVDREVRGRPGASDHAPAWVELALPA